MARRRRKVMPIPPPADGGYAFEVVELGPPKYLTPQPKIKARGPLIPAGDGEGLPPRPIPNPDRKTHSRRPLIPMRDEIETLPRLAQLAYAERCMQRVLPENPDAAVPDVAETVTRVARFLFEKVSIDTPLTAQLRCIRRDFIRLKRLVLEQKWTDDTPVPPDVFGPLWPQGIAPYWAVKAVESTPPAVE
jgi:hypothetical protein